VPSTLVPTPAKPVPPAFQAEQHSTASHEESQMSLEEEIEKLRSSLEQAVLREQEQLKAYEHRESELQSMVDHLLQQIEDSSSQSQVVESTSEREEEHQQDETTASAYRSRELQKRIVAKFRDRFADKRSVVTSAPALAPAAAQVQPTPTAPAPSMSTAPTAAPIETPPSELPATPSAPPPRMTKLTPAPSSSSSTRLDELVAQLEAQLSSEKEANEQKIRAMQEEWAKQTTESHAEWQALLQGQEQRYHQQIKLQQEQSSAHVLELQQLIDQQTEENSRQIESMRQESAKQISTFQSNNMVVLQKQLFDLEQEVFRWKSENAKLTLKITQLSSSRLPQPPAPPSPLKLHTAIEMPYPERPSTPEPPGSEDGVQIFMRIEDDSPEARQAFTLATLVSIRVPKLPPTIERPPIELVAIIDCSGSMEGEKMLAMQDTLRFLVKHALNENDKLGLVTFEETVQADVQLTKMDKAGQAHALRVISRMKADGKTNLHLGLVHGVRCLRAPERSQKPQTPGITRNRVIFFFTDGKANRGVTDTPTLLHEVKMAMERGGEDIVLHTFGYGADHNATKLSALAMQHFGMYYFIETPEDISVSFTDCLGGVVGSVAKDACLQLSVLTKDSSYIQNVQMPNVEFNPSQTQCTLKLGPLYAEDSKDVLLGFHVPRVSRPVDTPTPVLRGTLTYYSLIKERKVSVDVTQSMTRSLHARRSEPQPKKNWQIRHEARVAAVQAMERAIGLADHGNLDQARILLKATMKEASRAVETEDTMMQQLVTDLGHVTAGFRDNFTFQLTGRNRTASTAMAHMLQRSTHTMGAGYEGVIKAQLKQKLAGHVQGFSTLANGAQHEFRYAMLERAYFGNPLPPVFHSRKLSAPRTAWATPPLGFQRPSKAPPVRSLHLSPRPAAPQRMSVIHEQADLAHLGSHAASSAPPDPSKRSWPQR
jgi:uncharacterized protein YegL